MNFEMKVERLQKPLRVLVKIVKVMKGVQSAVGGVRLPPLQFDQADTVGGRDSASADDEGVHDVQTSDKVSLIRIT